MAIKVCDIFDIAKEHGISLVAGENGLDKDVKWFRVMESIEVLEFLEEGLLLFTTGLAIKGEKQLINLVKMQHQKNSSATVLHVGKNIKKIPDELIDYCNENDYPLLRVPWENSLPMMMKDFSALFLEYEREDKDLDQAMKNAISFSDKPELYLPIFKEHGCKEDDSYCVVVFEFCKDQELPQGNRKKQMMRRIKMILLSSGKKSFVIELERNLVFLFADYAKEIITQVAERLLKALIALEYDFLVGIGKNTKGVEKISESYLQATWCIKTSLQKKMKNCTVNFEDIGIYRILSQVGDYKLLKEYYNDTLGVLDEYDKLKGTNFKEVLRLYVNNNRSEKKVAESLYLHRNTVNYKISKIEKLLDCDLSQVEVFVRVYLALCIDNLLS